MHALFEIALSNAAVAALLALPVAAVSRFCRRPALIHTLWLLVLLKLVTPPIVPLAIKVPWPAAPVSEQEKELAARRQALLQRRLQLRAETSGAAASPRPPRSHAKQPVFKSLAAWLAECAAEYGEARWRWEPARQEDASRFWPTHLAADPRLALNPFAANAGEPPGTLSSAEEPFPDLAGTDVSGEDLAGADLTKAGLAAAGLPWRAETDSLLQALLAVLGGVWLLGAVFWFGLAAARVYQFQRLLRYSTLAPPAVQELTGRLARRLGLAKPPPVWLAPGPISPMLWALGGARILFPQALLARLDSQALETLLLHELAHLRRRDHWVRALEVVATGCYWWHPVVWLARAEIHHSEEECCDAWVLWRKPGSLRLYARALVQTIDFLAEAAVPRDGSRDSSRGGPAPLPLAASGLGAAESLRRRLVGMLANVRSRSLSWRLRLAVFALASLVLPVLPILRRGEPAAVPPRAAPLAAVPGAAAMSAMTMAEMAPSLAPEFDRLRWVQSLGAAPGAWSAEFSPDGAALAIAAGRGSAGEVRLWDTETEGELARLAAPRGASALAFSPDGRLLATAGYDRSIRLWDWRAGRQVAILFAHADVVDALAFSPDGNRLASGGRDGSLLLWSVFQRKVLRSYLNQPSPLAALAFSADGQQLAAAGGELRGGKGQFSTGGRLRVWDLAGGAEPLWTREHAVVRLAALAEGGWLALCEDGAICAWDALGAEPAHTCRPLPRPVSCTALSERNLLAVGDAEGSLSLWDRAAGAEVARLAPHRAAIVALGFSPDAVLSLGRDGELRKQPLRVAGAAK